MTKLRHPVALQTANGITKARHEVEIDILMINTRVTALVLPDTVNVLSMGRLIKENQFNYIWKAGETPYLAKDNVRFYTEPCNHVPLIVPALEDATPASGSSSDDFVPTTPEPTQEAIPEPTFAEQEQEVPPPPTPEPGATP